MKAHVEDRLAQHHATLETIRNENPRPECVMNFSFTTNDDYSMYYDEFIENLKETLYSSGPSSDKMNAISESILTKFEELKVVIDEAKAQETKEEAAYQGDILRKKEEDDFLAFLKQEVDLLGFDSMLRITKRLPNEVLESFQEVYKAMGFTHIEKEEWRDLIYYDSTKYDRKLSHVFDSKYRELGFTPFHNLTGYIQDEKISNSINRLLLVLDSEVS